MSTHTAIATTSLNVVESIELPTPSPDANEVLVEMNYGAMIAFDTYQVDRGYFVQSYPLVLGFSGSGIVKRVGAGVDDLKAGDRVATFNFPLAKNKSLQEFAVLPRAVVGKVPSNVSLLNAAAYPDNYVTAFWTLFSDKNLGLPIPDTLPATSSPAGANEPILIYGASTSAGVYMIQLLKLAGYNNIVAVASQRNHEYLKSLGASHTVDYRSADFTSELLGLTGGQRFNYAIDIIGARSSLTGLSKVVGPGARFGILIPVKEGDSVTNHPSTKMTSEIESWVTDLFPGVDIRPVATFTYTSDPYMRDNVMPKIFPSLLEKGVLEPNRVRLLKNGTFKERVEEGLDLLRNNKISGEKVVVEIKPE